MLDNLKLPAVIAAVLMLSACGSDNKSSEEIYSSDLKATLKADSAGVGLEAYMLPEAGDLASIPQDPNNPLTAEKVALGQFLYHETALAVNGVNPTRAGTWSCASCHQARAGFKSGILQGIAEGGEGFGLAGEGRTFADGFDAASADPTMRPDVQPLTSPAVLNAAYQEVMLWNGQFGNMVGGVVNLGIADAVLATPGTPKANNDRQLSGIETQAIAGLTVHRMKVVDDTILQTNATYQEMFAAAYPDGSTDVLEDAGKAVAAFERSIIANQAPFQLWLRGDKSAMSLEELKGAMLFFGDAGCSSCHRGPGLSSEAGATEDQVFMSMGFADFDPNNPAVTGTVDAASSKGRGGFTGEAADNYKFKIPQLYNLLDTNVFGHGGSFNSVRDVVAYMNAGIPQKVLPEGTLDSRFQPLGLTEEDIDNITAFLEISLYDPNLLRYEPSSLPSGNCFPVNDGVAQVDLGC
ncbi:cytochrome-c peroxidase [Halioxenophilus sp. WMMB6]|uniref:cytochrome-c peroxidase n=1 Tax=Halioxenophilus sp. WMMB6 TaxID=3073815 RepID=UPI00295E6576|nr:cytochrome c peroxidase [Halioxenophilus sp. WMMB6]